MTKKNQSERLYAEAQQVLVGGVNSPVRAFRAVGGTPFFVDRAKDAVIYDVDGGKYVDFVMSWGPLILGHAPAKVVEAVQQAAKSGLTFGTPCPGEVELARMVRDAFPGIEMVRFVSSGTEAVMTAIRLARAYRGVNKIIKFEGCYHGHSDYMLVKAGSGVATLGLPDSPGVPAASTLDTHLAPYNDLAAVEKIFDIFGEGIGAVIVEPIAANMGVIQPKTGFLEGLRKMCDKYSTVLIFDEVVTGFRAAYGGAQQLYKVTPDLTCLGKILGGGMAVGAVGGKRPIMQLLVPSGPVYQAGTLSGNPVTMAAGVETLKQLAHRGVYRELESSGVALQRGFEKAARAAKVPVRINRVGSLMTVFFTDKPVTDFESAKGSDAQRYARFFHAMLARGFYLPPSPFEAMFLSVAHTKREINAAVSAAEEAFAEVSKPLATAPRSPVGTST